MRGSRPMSFRFNKLDVAVLKWLAFHHKDTLAGVLRRGLRREMASVDPEKASDRGRKLQEEYAADAAASTTSGSRRNIKAGVAKTLKVVKGKRGVSTATVASTASIAEVTGEEADEQ